MAASKIAYGVRLSSPCKNCHHDDSFSKFVSDEGQVFHSCGLKVGAQWCNGKPVDKDNYAVIDPGKVAKDADGQLVAQYFNHRFDATGSPPPPAAPGGGATPPQGNAPPPPGATAGSAETGSYADLFDRIADCHAELSSLYAQLRVKFQAAGR